MAVKIRLRRVGAKKQPSYRLVAADSASPRDGRFLETLGFYNPRTDPPTVQVEESRVVHWLEQGAQTTDTVRRLLENTGLWQRWLESKGLTPAPASDALTEEPAAALEEPAAESEGG